MTDRLTRKIMLFYEKNIVNFHISSKRLPIKELIHTINCVLFDASLKDFSYSK